MNKVKKRKYQQTHNLLSGDTEKLEDREKSGTTEWISHWHENITLSIWDGILTLKFGSLQIVAFLLQFVRISINKKANLPFKN